ELEEAKEILSREQRYQQARELLKQRIKEKISELAGNVPRELEIKIGEYFSQLSRGVYSGVRLTENLGVGGIREDGQNAQEWDPWQLFFGERHQVALAVKIAMARALAETSGPVFIILDDSLVTFDPSRRAATEKLLLDLVADGKVQVILLTC